MRNSPTLSAQDSRYSSGGGPVSEGRFATQKAWAALRCPDCRSPVTRHAEHVTCDECDRSLPIEYGVVRCVESNDAFYEEAYLNEVRHLPGSDKLKDWVFFSLLQSGVFGQLRRVLQPEAVVLDVGCASGVRWLGNFHTVGVDLSFGSVRKTSAFYQLSVQASADKLPIASESVDVVYSSYFFEHVPPESKPQVLAELFRVMRPGAYCVVLFDVLSDGPFGRAARRDPGAFHRGFVAPDGHVGLEPLSQAAARFEQAGLHVEHLAKFGTTALQYMASYRWLANAYGDSVPWTRTLGQVVNKISPSRLRLPLELAITAFDSIINPYTSPDRATRAIVVARK